MKKAENIRVEIECYDIVICNCPYCGETNEYFERDEKIPQSGDELTCISCDNVFLYEED